MASAALARPVAAQVLPDSVARDSTPSDSTVAPPLKIRLGKDTLPLVLPTVRTRAELSYKEAAAQIAAARATAFQMNTRSIMQSVWGQVAAQTWASGSRSPALPGDATLRKPRPATKTEQLLANYADLELQFNGRLEFRAEKDETNRCQGSTVFFNLGCRSAFEPLLDFQYAVRSGGVVADRVHVNVDYDSQREFDASNTIAVSYDGKNNQVLQKLEVGNVTFQPPPSRFITAAIPSGNYGVQSVMNVGGGMRLRSILAQQKGNVVRDRVFTVGDRVLQAVDRTVEDYQFEPRRFFFTVDPTQFAGYPNVDILNRQQMMALARALPDTIRPVRLLVYRLQIGAQPPNPNGPQFRLLGDPRSRRGPVYELLREGVDYYVDPSLLWICLVRPLSLNNERLVVAYRVRLNGAETVYPNTGGTPDLQYDPTREQYANLLWDPTVKPGDPVFNREIRSVYRLGGNDVVRQSVTVKVVAGSAGDQEKPVSGAADTYLQLFGLAQSTNSSSFDVENRLWPRPTDANFALGVGAFGEHVIRDRFLIFPSVRPFATTGLAGVNNPHNDTVYTTPAEYLATSQRPQSVYHLRLRYHAEGNGDNGTLLLGAVQVRPNSERIVVDNILLTRGTDYTVDYDLGRVVFTRPDTLFPRPRQVVVQFEENPLFAETPTSIVGTALEIPLDNGQINVMALSQSQRTTYTRPALGLEPQATIIGGVNALLNFDAEPLTRLLSRLPGSEANAPSHVTLSAEFAASKPQPARGQQAYLESFEGEGGLQIRLDDQYWYYSSQPAAGHVLLTRFGPQALDLNRATTLAWQTNVAGANGAQFRPTIEQIDPQSTLVGAGVAPPEQLLWLTLYPLSIGGLREGNGQYNWQTGVTLTGRRWRSIRTPLGPSGSDVSRAENIEFWALISVDPLLKAKNPTLVFDVGDISENSVAFSPDTAILHAASANVRDTVYRGKQFQGLDRLDSERDPFSRTFNANVNDTGLAGDVAENITLIADTLPNQIPVPHVVPKFTTCRGGFRVVYPIGDTRTNCTAGNQRLDEEDIDNDNVLNMTTAERDNEQWHRYIVDLSDDQRYTRIGKCISAATIDPLAAPAEQRCWVFFRVPFRTPDDTLGVPLLRRARALRITMLSSSGASDADFSQIALDRLRLTGAPWLKRNDAVLRGIGGEEPSAGFVVAGTIGTQDRNVRTGVDYESPPGVTDAPDTKVVALGASRVQVNERSLRITAGGVNQFERAEAYYRFVEGDKNFMGYKELRVWARGVSNGWGTDGELQFYVKIGRDASNFYMYRTPLNGGTGKAAWLPEVRVDFQKLFTLRAQIQNAYLHGLPRNTCTGIDSVLIANTPLPVGVSASARYSACADGYMVYTIDPGVSAPNLAAVQELAVGMVRVAVGTGTRPIVPSDTLELWVDDVRLGGVVNAAGFAGQVGLGIIAGDFADFRFNISRRDPNFRQLGDQPTFLTDNALDVSAAFHLEKLFPKGFGYSLPVTVTHTRTSSEALYLSQSDIEADAVPGLRTPRTAATSVTFGIKRSTPLPRGALAPLLNNLSLNGVYTTANAQSEYQTGQAHDVRVGVEYNVLRALAPSIASLVPTELVLSTTYEHGNDRRLSFLKPAAAVNDTPRVVNGLTNTLRNGGVIAFRPLRSTSLRFNLTSLRDLRGYQGSALGVIDAAERDRIAGIDAGLERERAVGSQFSATPALFPWLRTRLGVMSSYNMLRDPNTLSFIRTADSSGDLRIPRRLGNTQTSSAGITLDMPTLVARATTISPAVRKLFRYFQPIDISLERNVLTSYDGVAASAPWSYQFGMGSLGTFRHLGDQTATFAGVNSQFNVTQGFSLPLGIVLTNHYQRLTLRNWSQQSDTTTAIGDATQLTFPDIALRWSARITDPDAPVTNFTATARMLGTKQLLRSPGEVAADSLGLGESRTRNYPLSMTVVWAGDRPVTTTFGANLIQRLDDRPGLNGHGNTVDMNADISKAFALPRDWHARSDLRTRLSLQNSHDRRFVLNPFAVGLQSRLTDNGRRAFTLTADTDVADNLASSFVISRVSSLDRNLNRQFTQTVLSAILHLQFYAGVLK